MKHKPERTCVGCREVFAKDEVVRIAAVSGSIVLDYREKLPGRAAYVCPRRSCIEMALKRNALARALKLKAPAPGFDEFVSQLVENVTGKIRSLISVSAKAGRLAVGYSAVQDAIEKNRTKVLLFAADSSEGTREKLGLQQQKWLPSVELPIKRDELGRILNRELVGVIGFEDRGLSAAVWKEAQRLKSLINDHE